MAGSVTQVKLAQLRFSKDKSEAVIKKGELSFEPKFFPKVAAFTSKIWQLLGFKSISEKNLTTFLKFALTRAEKSSSNNYQLSVDELCENNQGGCSNNEIYGELVKFDQELQRIKQDPTLKRYISVDAKAKQDLAELTCLNRIEMVRLLIKNDNNKTPENKPAIIDEIMRECPDSQWNNMLIKCTALINHELRSISKDEEACQELNTYLNLVLCKGEPATNKGQKNENEAIGTTDQALRKENKD